MKEILSETLNVISPMFSYGNIKPEARPSELKGLMRYIYRISNVMKKTTDLYSAETMMFGGVSKEQNKEKLIASPLRFEFRENKPNVNKTYIVNRNGYAHDGYAYDGDALDKSIFTYAYLINSTFNLRLNLRDNNSDNKNFGEQYYIDLLKLSLILGGIGKRSRRARGCMTYDDLSRMSRKKQIEFVFDMLKSINGENVFKKSRSIIRKDNGATTTDSELCRPTIQKIRFGKIIYKNDVDKFLEKVDKASHEIKGSDKSKKNNFATGFSSGNQRLSSAVIVSLSKTDDGIMPIYTYVTAILNGVFIDKEMEKRDEYVAKIEGAEKKDE